MRCPWPCSRWPGPEPGVAHPQLGLAGGLSTVEQARRPDLPNVGRSRGERCDDEDVQLSDSSDIMSAMREITVSDARARLADVVDAARVGHDPVYLTRRGQRVAAVIDADDLDALIASAEDLADIEAAKAARAEIADGEATIPWEQVKADLGLA